MCIVIPNFVKIGQTAAEILHLTFFEITAVRHPGFLITKHVLLCDYN